VLDVLREETVVCCVVCCSDHEFIEEQERHLYAKCIRTMALPVGRSVVECALVCGKFMVRESVLKNSF